MNTLSLFLYVVFFSGQHQKSTNNSTFRIWFLPTFINSAHIQWFDQYHNPWPSTFWLEIETVTLNDWAFPSFLNFFNPCSLLLDCMLEGYTIHICILLRSILLAMKVLPRFILTDEWIAFLYTIRFYFWALHYMTYSYFLS